jgi:hypothetical protein
VILRHGPRRSRRLLPPRWFPVAIARCMARGLPPLDALVVHVTGQREGRPGAGYVRVNGHPRRWSSRVPAGGPDGAS